MSNEIGLVRLVNRSSRTRPELIKICIINQVFRAAMEKLERQTDRDERKRVDGKKGSSQSISHSSRDLSGSTKPAKRKCLLSEALYKSALKIEFEIN